MALQSKVDVKIDIDDMSFNVTVSNLSKDQQTTLVEKNGDFEAKAKEKAQLSKQLSNKIERYQLLKADGQNKEALLILDEIESIEAQIGTQDQKEIEDMLGEVYRSRFLMMVTGPDKERMRSYIDEHNINYYEAMIYIENEAKKGKSKG
ncbi:hypothetical protein [Sulfuricurvum sp.]|uniref:hypothetical protein n=1 Tax=Sulfuricurvum sp. TaxID=2025608 RepID=UPI002E332E1B|nr:hypothetical protein [Sulfuricurvum sp.]HEX5330790.1 hypothetical protein [Sulfuricurvum sp.]